MSLEQSTSKLFQPLRDSLPRCHPGNLSTHDIDFPRILEAGERLGDIRAVGFTHATLNRTGQVVGDALEFGRFRIGHQFLGMGAEQQGIRRSFTCTRSDAGRYRALTLGIFDGPQRNRSRSACRRLFRVAHRGPLGQGPEPADLAGVTSIEAVTGHRCVVVLSRRPRAAGGAEPHPGERSADRDTLAVPCLLEDSSRACRTVLRRHRAKLRNQVRAHPDRTLRQRASLSLCRCFETLPRFHPPLGRFVYRSGEFEAERDVSDERLGTNPGVDSAAALVAELIAARFGLQRDPRNPGARGTAAFGRRGEVGRRNPQVLNQAPCERLHRRRQAAMGSGCLIELDAGFRILQRRPIERFVPVQALPHRDGKHGHRSGE